MINYEAMSLAILQALIKDPYSPEAYEDMLSCVKQWGTPESHEANAKFREIVAYNLGGAKGEKVQYLWEKYKESLLYDARVSFDAFLLYMEIDRKNDDRFYQPRRHYLRPIVDAYQQVLDGKLELLTVSMPKRAGKSQLGINFVLMLSGLHPNNSSLMEGAGDTLVSSFYKGCCEYLITERDKYNFYKIFPECDKMKPVTDAEKKTINLVNVNRFATITCRSIDSVQVGSTEATNVLYLDDCVAGRPEAMNRPLLDKKWEMISGDIMGRALEGTPVVMTGTRYSLYDPIGRMQDYARDEGLRWKAIEIPALDPITDESNYEYIRQGTPTFTTEHFRRQRDLLSAEQFESEFQQQPFEAKGLLFNRDTLNYYHDLPAGYDPDAIVAVCDTAENGEDSTALVVGALYGEDVYIIDVVFDNSAATITKPECAKCLIDNKVADCMFESNNAGEYYARDVAELIKQHHGRVGIRTKRTVSNKRTRIEVSSDNIIKHFYFKAWDALPITGQYYSFMQEVTKYTRSGKVRHDDAPDALSLLENEIRNLSVNKAKVIQRPF